MNEELSHQQLGDMIVASSEELDQRVSLDRDTRRIVLIAVALAANNRRIIGAKELIGPGHPAGHRLERPGGTR